MTYDQQVTDAEVVFVGSVRSSSVESKRGKNDFALSLRTTSFAVDCTLRGDRDQRVEVTEIYGEDHANRVAKGGTYLVFGEYRTLLGEYRRLVPMGYLQGIYAVDERGRASNESNGEHELAEVVREVEARGSR
ncbi:MAG: hypothetical protein JWM90_2165 [Thermoleophilia bacterium]|nr:hypothetical protein [Thermoleophilia bacterium]